MAEALGFQRRQGTLIVQHIELLPNPRLNNNNLANGAQSTATLKDIAESRIAALRFLSLEDWEAVRELARANMETATNYINIRAEEGKRRYRIAVELERSSALARSAKERNKQDNGGAYQGEACDFRADQAVLFDSHHLFPLSLGERKTCAVLDFAVLCPTCHRIAHHKSTSISKPLSVVQIRNFRSECDQKA
jgi:predicted HNH restriction endonuclease